MAEPKRVGILGSGEVGQALGRGFIRHGYQVMIGSREPGKLADWQKEVGENAHVGSPTEAARFADVVIVATNGSGTEAALDLAGAASFAGKLVLDASNPLDFSHGMPPGLFLGTTDSLGERVQRKLPDAHVVKCFNTVGNTQMVDPQFNLGAPRMMICGNDAGAKQRTEAILQELGWPGVIDLGGIEGARWLEALVPLWVRTGVALNTWSHAFTPIT